MDIREIIREAVKEFGTDLPFVELEVPRNSKHGDLSTPVAMLLARVLRKHPREIAEKIAYKLTCTGHFEKIDIAGAGFINVIFKKDYLYDELELLLTNPSSYLTKNIGKGQKLQIEMVSANPTGPLHLGHGRGAAIGAALCNLLEKAGFNVEREFYINDAGRQVKLLGESLFACYKETLGIDYTFPIDGYKGEYIKKLSEKLVNEIGDKYKYSALAEVEDFFVHYGVEEMLKWIESDLLEFNLSFDCWQSEKELYDKGVVKRCLEELREKGKLYEKDGALWFRAADFGDDKDRVVIKSDGSYTYFASDIAYHWYKIQRGFEGLINIWGADHHGYIPRIKSVIKALGYPEEKLNILLVQMVTLLRGGNSVQMSKRTGDFVTLKEVIEEVGADITKFIFLTRRPDSHLEFDIEVAKEKSSENPVYYVQYAYARINSIFRNAKERSLNVNELHKRSLLGSLKEEEELKLIKKVLFYPLMFEGAVREKEPHRVTFYLQDLAGLFHPYYNTHRILGVELHLTMARLALCKSIELVLNEGLSILGVSAPEKM